MRLNPCSTTLVNTQTLGGPVGPTLTSVLSTPTRLPHPPPTISPFDGEMPILSDDVVTAGISLTMQGYIGGLVFEAWLYGMFCILFCAAIYLLWSNRRTTRSLFLATLVLMFLISTTNIVLSTHTCFHYVLRNKHVPSRFIYARLLFYITNNVVADLLLIYRCFMVWGRSLLVIIIPATLLVGSSACGYLFSVTTSPQLRAQLPTYLWMTFALNVLVTALTAGRIIWIARQANEILGPNHTRRYYIIGAVLIESGAIYSIYVLVDLLVVSYVIDAGLVQVVAIVPTLIIVQVGLGRHVAEDVDSVLSAQVAVPGGSSTPVLDSIFSTDPEPMPMETDPMTDPGERPLADHQSKGKEGSLGLGSQPLSRAASLRSARSTCQDSGKGAEAPLHLTSSPFPPAVQKVESRPLSHHSSRLSMTTPRRSHSHDTIPMIPPRRSMSISRLDA